MKITPATPEPKVTLSWYARRSGQHGQQSVNERSAHVTFNLHQRLWERIPIALGAGYQIVGRDRRPPLATDQRMQQSDVRVVAGRHDERDTFLAGHPFKSPLHGHRSGRGDETRKCHCRHAKILPAGHDPVIRWTLECGDLCGSRAWRAGADSGIMRAWNSPHPLLGYAPSSKTAKSG